MNWHIYTFFVLIASVALIAGCSSIVKEPQIDVKDVAVTSASLQEIILNVTLNVDNPNPVGVAIKSVVFDLYYQQGSDWIAIGHGEGGGYDIKPGMNEISVPVTVKSSELLSAGIGALSKGEITVQIRELRFPTCSGSTQRFRFLKRKQYR